MSGGRDETGTDAASLPGAPDAHPPLTRNPDPVVQAPSADVQLAEDATPLPGAHRGGFSRLPTAPVAVTTQSAPGDADPAQPEVRWVLPTLQQYRGIAAWALGFSIAGLVVALFVGWGFPLGIVGIATAIVALRRPLENRTAALWALVLGAVSIAYSALWLVWAASRANLLG